MNVPSEYFLYVGVFIGTALWAIFLTRNRRPKTLVKNVEDVVVLAKSAAPAPAVPVVSLPTVAPLVHTWQLEVNGVAKFDIKVEWNDGVTDKYSGTAPQVYGVVRPYGCFPVNTSGIAPEWADDGISYQWSLNGQHWS